MLKLSKITSLLFLCNILRKKVINEIDFLHADEHEKFLQIDTMILMGMIKYSQSSQNSKFTMSLQYLINIVRDEVGFLRADKTSKFSTSWFQHFGY